MLSYHSLYSANNKMNVDMASTSCITRQGLDLDGIGAIFVNTAQFQYVQFIIGGRGRKTM